MYLPNLAGARRPRIQQLRYPRGEQRKQNDLLASLEDAIAERPSDQNIAFKHCGKQN
jgi:hypothetical protein